ncbi:DUF2577 domain-containing protein [Paenibacillus mesotrionivorans]|jgi:hypothetical protein|uniref:DUF2577 domain-containing protein n=1 Tax=Paenibacillus mesotrionivorans TaxID=3160968 RepID=A0ACC7NWN7_9BACL
MLNAIRQAALTGMEAGKPMAVLFGEVISGNPLQVNVDQRFILDADFLIVPDSLTRLELDLSHTHGSGGQGLATPVVIRPGLEAGDKVILLRVQGGQQFLIMDKVAVL